MSSSSEAPEAVALTETGPPPGMGAVIQAASAAGLRMDSTFSDADLVKVPGPFVTMNVADGSGANIVACVALRDTLSPDDGLLQTLATAVAAAVNSGQAPTPAGPVGTGADLPLRFTMPVTAIALTDGTEIQALVVTPTERRGESIGGNASPPAATIPQPASLPETVSANPASARVGSLDKLVNVALDVSVELGRTSVTLAEVLEYDVGSVIELDRAAGAPVDVRVNGMLLAQGEVVLIDDEYAVRITAIFDPHADR